MTQKASIHYQLTDMRKAMIAYYIGFTAVVGLLVGTAAAAAANGSANMTVSMSGFNFGTIIFLFVCGLNSFREPFRMLIQNGSSRKTVFLGRMITILAMSGIAAVADKLLALAFKAVASRVGMEFFWEFYELVYHTRAGQIGGVQIFFEGLLLNFFLYASAMAVGYFITIGYYRMNKPAKIIVSISVPMLLIYGIPLLDWNFTGGKIMDAAGQVILFAFGFKNGGNPYFGMATGLIVTALFGGLCWLFMRRAPVKD